MTVAQLEKFSKNFVINEDGCWVWQKRPNNSGYGSAYDGHSRVVAHRAMYTAFYGPIPEKQISAMRSKPEEPPRLNTGLSLGG